MSAPNVLIRVTPRIQALLRGRGVFPELHGLESDPRLITGVVAKARAAEVLVDARSQLDVVQGSDKKALRHFIEQLEEVTGSPAHAERKRIAALKGDALDRAEEWLQKLRATKIGQYADSINGPIERYAAELRRFGTIGGHPIDSKYQRDMLNALNAAEEICLERQLAWFSRVCAEEADAVIAKAAAR